MLRTTPAVWPLTLVLALLLLPSALPGQGRAPRDLDAYIDRAVQDWGIAGLSIAIVEGDSVVYARGFGVREAGRPERVDENTLFAIGSNTKLFTAVLAGMLVDEGRMGWDDPATKHLPGFQLHDPYVTREITIRDLLSHRSGLGRRGDLIWYGSGLDRAEILRRVRFLEPNSSFRSSFGYQNIMFLAAGEASAAAAGRSWDELIRARIFAPLGMRTSGTSVQELRGQPNVAAPHIVSEGRLVPVPYRDIDNAAPAGSINSSAREMAEWMRMLLAGGVHGGRTLIREATLREIATPHTLMPFAPDTLFPSTHFSAYGLGVGMNDYRGEKVLRHTGGIDGMLSLVAMIPERRLGVVVLTNTAGPNNLYTALMYRVFDAYLGAPERDWSAILLARTREATERTAEARQRAYTTRVTGTRPSLALERYAGRYHNPVYGDVTVAHEGGGLVLRFGPAFTADLEHWHHDSFRPRWRDASAFGDDLSLATFTLDARGNPHTLEVAGLDRFRRAQERPAR